MDNSEKYKLIADGEISLASDMAVIPKSKDFSFDAEFIKVALNEAKDFKLLSFKNGSAEDESLNAEEVFTAEIQYESDTFVVELSVFKNEILNLDDFGFGNVIDKESLEIAKAQPFHLNVHMYFNDNALSSFHLQLKILHAIVPDAALCIDFMPYRLLSARWLAMTAKSQTPPSPDYLYTIHAVYEESNGEKVYWFHTHGLHRCGLVDVEMVNIKQGAQEMHTLLNMIAKKMLADPAQEKERFTIGYDGMGIDICWLRWEEALTDFPRDVLGGLNERVEADNIHAEPVGVVFAVEDGNMISPEIYAKTLAENPIFYITNEETDRMSALAKERFYMFKQVFESKQNPKRKSFLNQLFGIKSKGKERNDGWLFIVKLGLNVDEPQSASEREHLWFEVKGIDSDNNIEGKLMNQPYWISGLKEGDVQTYPVDLLTDFLIYGPDSTYSSDTIYELGFE